MTAATYVLLALFLATPGARALELRFRPSEDRQTQEKAEQRRNLQTAAIKAAVDKLALKYPLSPDERQLVVAVVLKDECPAYFEGYSFTSRDIEILDRLIGIKSRSEGRDLKHKYLEEAGLNPMFIVTASMNSLLVHLMEARAKALFGSGDVENWRPPQDVLAKHAKDVFLLLE